jgi:hypothetical protein
MPPTNRTLRVLRSPKIEVAPGFCPGCQRDRQPAELPRHSRALNSRAAYPESASFGLY